MRPATPMSNSSCNLQDNNLIFKILIPGIFGGLIDSGIQSILLEVWGPVKSRPLVQSFHFMYTVGAFLAPLIMGLASKIIFPLEIIEFS